MLEFLETYLPVCIYILLIILLVIGIMIGVRLINTMDKVDGIVDNVERKVNSLNGFFNVVDFTTDKISIFTDRVVDTFTGLIGKIGHRKNSKKKIEEEN